MMKVIDNFLEEEYFNKLSSTVCSTNYDFAWYYGSYHPYFGDKNDPLQYFFTHIVYKNNVPQSPCFDLCQGLLKVIDAKGEGIKSLLRIRANYFPNTPNNIHEYPMHIDMDFSHTAAILSFNTCDGYTKLADGTKIDSVENRVILFDAGEEHTGTTTTNEKARFNIIVNYL